MRWPRLPSEQPAVPGGTDSAERQRLQGAPVSPLLNHLLECRADSGRERGRDAGGEPVPTADSLFDEEAARYPNKEDYYREHGIISRNMKRRIKWREAQPDVELASYAGRIRPRVVNRLKRAEMVEDEDV